MNSGRVWIVDDDRSIRWVLAKALERAGMEVQSFEDGEAVLTAMDSDSPDVLVSDVRMPGMSGLNLLQQVHERQPQLPVIIMTAHSDLDSAVSSFEGGAFEYLPKPFDVDESVELVQRALRHLSETAAKSKRPAAKPNGPTIIGEAPAMQEVFRAIGRLTRSNITVLITGESGTGKELVASALHQHSPRASGPYIAINTAAIPKDLLESELFGHERGAFTGATALRRGRFEQADGGTLFLDEIGDMPADLQTRLLRVLADGEFYRVGGHVPVKVDVRIVAATHQDLETHARAGSFREDLFHRLNVIRIQLPALRERREDIPTLTKHFLDRAARELEVEPKQLRPEVADYLQAQPWPGNVRQLENTCRWLTVMAAGRELHLDDLPPELRGPLSLPASTGDSTSTAEGDWAALLRRWADARLTAGDQGILTTAVPMFERVMIAAALQATDGHRQEAARLLGWGRNTLTRKIQQLEQGEAPTFE